MSFHPSIIVDYGRAEKKYTHKGVLIGLGIGIVMCLFVLAQL